MLVFVEGITTASCPAAEVCLTLEVTPLTNETTSVGDFPLMVEDAGVPEAGPGFQTAGVGLEG